MEHTSYDDIPYYLLILSDSEKETGYSRSTRGHEDKSTTCIVVLWAIILGESL